MDTALSTSTRPGTLRRFRLGLGEGWQSLLGALMVLALIPFIFHMDPVRFRPFFYDLLASGAFAEKPFTGEWWWAWRFLGQGLRTTVLVASLSILLSLPLATVFALLRVSSPAWLGLRTVTAGERARALPLVLLRLLSIALIEGIRALPVLLFIWFTFRFLERQELRVEVLWPVVIALTLYTTVVNAETLRAGILALPHGQMEAARSVGMTYLQAMRYVILPQTFRHMLPPLIAQFATLVKDTSLGYIVGLIELTKTGTIIYMGYFNTMETIYVIAIIYFVLNYLLGQLAVWVHRRVGG